MVSRYHWTFDYAVWGISWANAQLMMADAMRIHSDTDKTEDDIIDLNDPISLNKLLKIAER